MSATKNHHGEWEVRGSKGWVERIEKIVGHKLGKNDDRHPDNKYGQPFDSLERCTYCGSLTPEDFVKACEAGYPMEVADWKYGWPHKVYVDWPNPNPDEQRIISTTHGGPNADPETGKVPGSEVWGTYPTLHCKFYAEHLETFGDLDKYSDLIEHRTGVRFTIGENGGLHYIGYYRGI